MQQLKVIISGGGTGGHIFPAIAIANALKALQPNVDILFVGAEGKMEMEKVPQAGYKIVGLPVVGLQRKLTLKNLKFPFMLWKSLMLAKKIVKEFNPAVVIGVGGYASGPTLRMAVKLGIPTLIQEQNSFPGLTNRLLAKKVNRICVAYPGMEKFFPKEKISYTGNPVRQDIADVASKRMKGLEMFGLNPEKKTILVIGGSLGARTINQSMAGSLSALAEKNIQLIWQTGKGYYPEAVEHIKPFQNKGMSCFAFITQMDYAYAVADVVLSRAGAISVSEICLAGKAAILIPSPNVAEDHQTKNALALTHQQAALLVKDSEAPEKLLPEAINLLADEDKRIALQTNAAKLAMPDAAKCIAEEAIKIAEK